MSGIANFNSIVRENRWILAIDSYFSKDHVVDIDLQTTKCVYRVPKTSTETKPEAYAPRRLGLGPYHHLRPDFYNTQLQKVSRVRKFLGPEKLQVFKQVVAALVQREPVVRACYDEYLDFDIKALARILAVDSLYLLQFFDARKSGEITDQMMRDVAGDILMVENQIPIVLLKVILKILQLNEIGGSQDHVLSAEFPNFCRAHSPLDLDEMRREWVDKKQLHLLDRMYHSIVMNRGNGSEQISMASLSESADNVTTILGFLGVQTAAPAQILAIVERAKKIRDQLKGVGAASEEITASTPTASELSETAGVKFDRTPGGIMDTMYSVDKKILLLPRIKLDSNSEIVLRNLVAYEAAATAASATAGATLWLAEYVDLMCGMIRANKDVGVLKKAGIIVAGEMSDEEIVRVFDGIGKSTGDRGKKRSNIVEEVSKSYDDVGSVRVKRFVKKWLSVSWKIISLVVAVAVLAVLVVQAFCSVFGCGRWFGRSAPVQAFRFLYADQ